MKSLRNIFIVMLASGGIRLDKLSDSRIDALFFIIIGYASHTFFAQYVSMQAAIIYFFVLFIVRYLYLFGGFMKNGFTRVLIQKYGEEKAWGMYELVTSVMFFQRGLSFGLLTDTTQWSLMALPFGMEVDFLVVRYVCMGLGVLLVLAGMWVNIASTFVIGIDTYYYKDLFLKRPVVDFKVEGPYKYFSNPMYGIGQCSGYGAALMVGSLEGILGTLLNQVMMYIFYFTIEKPHIKEIMNANPEETLQLQEEEIALQNG